MMREIPVAAIHSVCLCSMRECRADLLASATALLTFADLLHWYQEWDCCYDYDEVHCKTGVGRTARKTIGR